MSDQLKVATPQCALDTNGCVSLQDILLSFNAPITEQHAWALCYQSARCFRACLPAGPCFCVSEPAHLLLHRDGHVHPVSVLPPGPAPNAGAEGSRVPAASEAKIVVELGVMLFRALDFGVDAREERCLSADLERLIDIMTSAEDGEEQHERHPETDDEGIERDSGDGEDEAAGCRAGGGDGGGHWLERVLQDCVQHLGPPSAAQAEAHYRNVCRALVAEALELASFLERVSQGTGDLQARAEAATDLAHLQFADWTGLRMWRVLQARLWVQVIHELRHGVKLKKVTCCSRPPIEFELTPYEILMDDIRSRRYKLNKVMVDGELPQRVKKDAHAVILEFIRSRPPLRKSTERQLGPARACQRTPREQLLDSIRRGHRLRSRRRPSSSGMPQAQPQPQQPQQQAAGSGEPSSNPAGASSSAGPGSSKRRLIKVDFSMLQLDDEDEEEEEEAGGARGAASPGSGRPWQRTGTRAEDLSYLRYLDSALESYDLATQCPRRPAMARRHTLAAGSGPGGGAESGSQSLPQSRPASRGPTPSSASSEAGSQAGLGTLPELSWSRSSLQDDLLHSRSWQAAMECLSLTLEEIVHIRSVLTKAELESLPVEGRVKEDVEKKKVCFLCLKTRFGIFGPWGQACRLCERTVCAKCCSKMRIPTEHFSRVPVFALSPGLSSPEDEEQPSFPRSLVNRLLVPNAARASVGSAPASPGPARADCASAASTVDSTDGPQSLPAFSPAVSTPASTASERRSRLSRSRTVGRPDSRKEKLKGLQMTVCHDCKTMVLQIIKSSRTSRTNAIRNLTLNLSPVY